MADNDFAKAYPTWPHVQAFYEERGGRRSGECAFGVHHWVNRANDRATAFDRWRVSVIAETGDVCACDDWAGDVLLLGTLVANEVDSLAAERIDAKNAERYLSPPIYCATGRIFRAWADDGNVGGNLAWFAARIARQQEVG